MRNLAIPLFSLAFCCSAALSQDLHVTPGIQIVRNGSTVQFSATSGNLGLTNFLWQFDQRFIPGATNSTLILTNVQPADEGTYRALPASSAAPDALLASNPALLKVCWQVQLASIEKDLPPVSSQTGNIIRSRPCRPTSL